MAGNNTYAKHVCWRRRDGGINTYAKHCLIPRRPAMIHKVTFLLLVLLHDQKYQKSYKRRSTSYISPPCRLAATRANKVPRPSDYSMVTATGSKRSSADSDLLLCHVRLWQTSRLKFGCVSVCEHSEIKFALHNTHVTPHPPLSRSPFSHWRRLIVTSVSAQTKFTPALHFQRACRQCVHESARLSRVICSHAW